MPFYIKITKAGLSILKEGPSAGPHKGWLEVSSAIVSERHTIRGSASRTSETATQMSEIQITKLIDTNSAMLMHLSNTSEKLKIEIDYTEKGSGRKVLSVTLHNAEINNYAVGGRGVDGPSEIISVYFESATYDKHGAGSDITQEFGRSTRMK